MLLAALLAWVLPELEPPDSNSQITGRVSPTLVDLVAAATTGLAGSFAVARRDIGDILPGVAIAISLVPPLAVVGVTADAGDWSGALGAFLLFLTNVLAIVVVGAALFGALRARSGVPAEAGFRRRRVYAVVAISGVVVVAALTVLTVRTVQLTTWRDAATRVASGWAEDNGERLLGARFDGDTLVLVVEGMGDGSRDEELVELLRGELPSGTPIALNRVAGSRRELGDVAS